LLELRSVGEGDQTEKAESQWNTMKPADDPLSRETMVSASSPGYH
jgi:hypothetical protein